ncbi:MAG: hypothetical protein Q4D14_06590 [Bacteroidales bacterium]|nr:hypothetical protein [Bacteroidales bacterium]
MENTLLEQFEALHELYKEANPTELKDIEQYAKIICLVLTQNTEELGALKCRQLLAEAMKLDLKRPSYHYSSILWAACKVASTFTEFHFVPFLNLWNPTDNLRQEDYKQSKDKEGKLYPSLAERMTKLCRQAQLIRPEEKTTFTLSKTFGYTSICPMLVTKVTTAEKNHRKLHFVRLSLSNGVEVEAEAHALRANPLEPSDKRHYVNVGQVYNVLLREKSEPKSYRLVDAVLSKQHITEVFTCQVGYVEHIDKEHGHIHIYDGFSRHFVSEGQKFIRCAEGDFVSFIPVVPRESRFKKAIIVTTTQTQHTLYEQFPPREVIITYVNEEKNFCRWELTNPDKPVVEQLSPLQVAEGETPTPFTAGFIDIDKLQSWSVPVVKGQKFECIIFLKRNKEKHKFPMLVVVKA